MPVSRVHALAIANPSKVLPPMSRIQHLLRGRCCWCFGLIGRLWLYYTRLLQHCRVYAGKWVKPEQPASEEPVDNNANDDPPSVYQGPFISNRKRSELPPDFRLS
jgi:hypothetical protein